MWLFGYVHWMWIFIFGFPSTRSSPCACWIDNTLGSLIEWFIFTTHPFIIIQCKTSLKCVHSTILSHMLVFSSLFNVKLYSRVYTHQSITRVWVFALSMITSHLWLMGFFPLLACIIRGPSHVNPYVFYLWEFHNWHF